MVPSMSRSIGKAARSGISFSAVVESKMPDVNAQPHSDAWLDKPQAERAQILRWYWAKKEKFVFRLQSPPCEHEWLTGTVRWVSVTGGLVHVNGGKGIGLIEV